MRNLLTKKLNFYFQQVEQGTITGEYAMKNFLLEFGGKSVFIPKRILSKRETIIKAYNDNLAPQIISDRYGISLNYVYQIISEHNGEEFQKRMGVE